MADENQSAATKPLDESEAFRERKRGAMRSVARVVLIFLLLASFVTGYTGRGLAKDHKFIPPDVTSASDIPYPINTMVYGIVTLTVNLNESGRIQKTEVLRDVPPLTDAVIAAMNDWTFRPGMLDGVAVPASLNVSVVFNPANLPRIENHAHIE